MADDVKVGDHVTWNSPEGLIHGKVTKSHSKDVEFMGKTYCADKEDPLFEVKSDKTGHSAIHKASALKVAKE